MPRSAATRSHFSSLQGGDAAACRRPHSRGSTVGSMWEAPSLGMKECRKLAVKPANGHVSSNYLPVWRFSL